ncbi:MAG TPA: BBP7 family outer membrane beta-barrel protein [Pirellulaceae bacterium]|jgi:hypothetical protein
MRRTITTLMILAVGGLALAARAADSGTANYYSTGQSHYKISDDDDASGAAESSTVANAVGTSQAAGQEKKALYVAEKTKSAGELLQTNYFAAGNGCQDACGCNNNCGCNGCNTCLSDCCCDCTTDGFRMEWLGWFSRGRNTPPLVTTSPVGTPVINGGVPTAGVIAPGFATSVLYGNDPIGTNLRNGGRLTYSHLFQDGITSGTLRFWGIENGSATFATNQTQTPIIGLPFNDTLLGVPNAYLAAHPDLTTSGDVRVLSKNSIIGADAYASRNWYSDGYSSIDVLGGYQFARLDDSIAIATNSVTNGAAALPNATINTFDSFRTQNEFHGGSFGFLAKSYRGPITLEGLFKVAAGNQRERVTISGNNTVSGLSTPGGIFTQPTNIGSVQQNHFVFIPELNTNLVYNVNQSWRLTCGYTFIYWSRALLAGNQIDTNVNSSQLFGGNLAGSATPAPKFQRTDFWVQGISLGSEFRW